MTPHRSRRSSLGGRPSFPILHPSEIIQALASMDIEITKDELNEPHRNRDKLRNIFIHLLNTCTGKRDEDFMVDKKVLDVTKTFVDETSSQLHAGVEQYVELKMFLGLRKLFESCDYHDFSWRDLYGTPTPKRLQQQLSALCNLAGNFLTEQLKVFAEMSEVRNVFVVAFHEVNTANTQLLAEYEQLEIEANVSSEEVDQIMQECQQLELEIAHNNKLQSASRGEAAALKKQTNDLKDELATAVWALQEAQAEEENLRMQVVTSPDRRRANVQRSKQELETQKKGNAKLDAQLQDVKMKIVRLEQANKEFDQVGKQLDELLAQMEKYKEIVEELEQTLERIKASEKELSVIQGASDEAKHLHKRLEEKIASQRYQHKVQLKGAQEALELVKSSLLLVEKDRRDALERRQASENEIRNLEASMVQQTAKTDEEIQVMIAEYKEVERLFLERQNNRFAAIGILGH